MSPTKPMGPLRLLVIALLVFISLGKGCGGWHDELRHNLNGMGIGNHDSLPRPYRYRTPKGAIVESVDPVPQSALDALDRGFQRRIDRFRDPRMWPLFTAATQVAGTRVIFVRPNRLMPPIGDTRPPTPPCVLESIPGAPCLYTNGIKTAGTVAGLHDLWNHISLDPPLILPSQHPTWEWLDYLAAAAHNEDEHRSTFLNRKNPPTGMFYNFLGANDIHPFIYDVNNPVPYLVEDELDRLIKAIPSHCVPSEDDMKKVKQFLNEGGKFEAD